MIAPHEEKETERGIDPQGLRKTKKMFAPWKQIALIVHTYTHLLGLMQSRKHDITIDFDLKPHNTYINMYISMRSILTFKSNPR